MTDTVFASKLRKIWNKGEYVEAAWFANLKYHQTQVTRVPDATNKTPET